MSYGMTYAWYELLLHIPTLHVISYHACHAIRHTWKRRNSCKGSMIHDLFDALQMTKLAVVTKDVGIGKTLNSINSIVHQ